MGISILAGTKDGGSDEGAALYCNTSGIVLACPMFDDAGEAERFLTWSHREVRGDLRYYKAEELFGFVQQFREEFPDEDAFEEWALAITEGS